MASLSFEKTADTHIETLYRHLSVQSMLDMKAVNGEVNIDILRGLYAQSHKSVTVLYGGRVAYVVFVVPTDVSEFGVYMFSTSLSTTDGAFLNKSFESVIRDLPNCKLYSIVYEGNHRYAKLLKDNGFRFVRNILHGVEKRNFLLLGKNTDGKASAQ